MCQELELDASLSCRDHGLPRLRGGLASEAKSLKIAL